VSDHRRLHGRSRHARPRNDNYVLEEQVGFLLRAASQRNTTLFKEAMVHGLTRVQFAAMAKLLAIGSCPQNELGRLILLDRATIKGVVTRLRRRRFLQVASDRADRRQHILSLTKLGRKVVERAIEVAPSITEKMLQPLNSQERTQILHLLRKICVNAQDGKEK
jgi:DNA-binding MarR family transcriptional regulator